MALAACAAGAQTLVAQTLLVREELLLYGGNEVAIGAFLGLWLAGIVTGALAAQRIESHLARLTVPLLLIQGALPLLAVLAARVARDLSGIPAYEPFPLLLLLLWTLPVAVPVSLTTGALVPALAARARRVRGSVTGIYVAEAIGSLLGGAGTALLLVTGAQTATLALGCLALGAGAAGALTTGKPRIGALVLTAAACAVAISAGPPLGETLRRRHLESVLPGAELLDHLDTASASLVLAALGRQQVLLLDGRVVAAFPDPERVERDAGVLAALTGAPQRLLIVGSQAADTLPALPSFAGLASVVWILPDPGTRDFALQHLPGLATETRLEILLGDPVRRADALAERAPFDAIWLMVDTPLTRADDRYVARETLAALGRLLAPDGVLAVPVRSAENYVGARLRLAVGTVIAGLADATEHVWLVPGEDGLVLGAHQRAALLRDPDALERAYQQMRPRPSRLTRDGLAALLDPARVARADSLVAALQGDPAVQASHLDRPLALFHNLLVRAEQESDELVRLLEAVRRTGVAAAAPLAVLALFALAGVTIRRHRRDSQKAAALAVLASGGAVGMGLNLLLLHIYQGRFGTLYLEVGWLFGLWMGGLAVGGLVGRRLCGRLGAPTVGLAALGALIAIAALVGVGGSAAIPARIIGAIAFALCGALSGGLVPVAEALLATAGILGARAGIGIEAADHLGGAGAALLLGIIGIPILGLAYVAWIVAGMAAFGIAALLLAELRGRRILARAIERWLSRAAAYESFPFRRSTFLLLSIAAAAIVGHLVAERLLLGPRLRLEATELAGAGLTPPFSEVSDPVLHYVSTGDATGPIALASRAAAPRVQGYGGPINLLVAAARDGRIRHVDFLEHSETPTYVETADELFAALEGKSLLAPFDVQPRTPGVKPNGSASQAGAPEAQRVDAITAATVTSRAVARALEQTGQRLAQPVFGRPYAGTGSQVDLSDPRFLYLLASLLLVIPILLVQGRWLRRVWLALHAGIGGLWLGVQLSTVQPLAWLRLEPELDLLTFTGLLAAVVLFAAAVGPVYCGHLCPAGALQELLGLLGLARRMPAELDRLARYVKYGLLALLVVAALGLGSESILRVDLLREVWAEHRSSAGVALLVLVVAGSLLTVRFGCRYLCPTGAFLNLLGKVALLKRLLPAKDYPACDLGVRGLPDVDCMQCNRCIIGETRAEAPAWRVDTFKVAMVAAILLLVVAAWPGSDGAGTPAGPQPQVRPIDVQRIEARTRAGRLSSRPAEYWHVVR